MNKRKVSLERPRLHREIFDPQLIDDQRSHLKSASQRFGPNKRGVTLELKARTKRRCKQ